MDNNELNCAIHVKLGKCWHKFDLEHLRPEKDRGDMTLSQKERMYCKHCNEDRMNIIMFKYNPDYCDSRDLCADIVSGFNDEQGALFSWTIAEKLDNLDPGHGQLFHFLAAPPRLWADAVYETLTSSSSSHPSQ